MNYKEFCIFSKKLTFLIFGKGNFDFEFPIEMSYQKGDVSCISLTTKTKRALEKKSKHLHTKIYNRFKGELS